MSTRIRRKREQSPCRLALVLPFAMTLAALLWPGKAFADGCSGLAACQVTDQERLLGTFNALLGSPEGVAVLATNLQTQNSIYLNSTQAQKITSGTVLIVQYIPTNILLRAFLENPNFGYTQGGLPMGAARPNSVTAAVNDIYGNTQLNAMKPFFGSINVYQHAYGLLPGQIDSVGNPPPYQVSAAIHDNPFTTANSSPLAAQNQQTQGARASTGWTRVIR